MFFFEGSKCPFCGEEFKKDDDVVACPVCGTPHHRECYRNNGACAFDEKHDEGYVWQREEKEEPENVPADNICSRCGNANAAGRLWCEKCGAPLGDRVKNYGAADSAGNSTEDSTGNPWQSSNGYYSVSGEMSIPDNELIDEVPAGDLKRFIKGSAYYYVPLFSAFARFGRKISFNMMALFTHGLWFLSRKMYLLGSVVLAVQTAIFAFQSYCSVELEDLMNLYAKGDMTAAYKMVAELMVERPVLIYGMFATTVLHYGIIFGCGLLSNWLYKEHCVRKVKKLNARSKTAEEFNAALDNNGGTALPLAVGCAVLYVAVRMFLQVLFQR